MSPLKNPTIIPPLQSSRDDEAAKKKKKKTYEEEDKDKENVVVNSDGGRRDGNLKERKMVLRETRAELKPSSLQICMQMDETVTGLGAGSVFGSKVWGSEGSNSGNVWDYSDSEAAPASAWSTLSNRTLLCKQLPVDIGGCSCVIVKEAVPKGLGGGALYCFYTSEGQGRQNRKLALAYHKRHNGRSRFFVTQKPKGGNSFRADDTFKCFLSANLVGSKYSIWDQDISSSGPKKQSRQLQALVAFTPTISSWTGSHRSMKVWIPKNATLLHKQSKLKHAKGLHEVWERNTDNSYLLRSRVPQYNKITKQYELDFRERGKGGLRIQSSVKNFQLVEENGGQTVLQMGRVGKSKYLVDYRFPLAGYQAFCICLASIDSKLCCTV
ncbi:hypothetical protein Drorol1_Dr00007662 [Drosera rotundifolia]